MKAFNALFCKILILIFLLITYQFIPTGQALRFSKRLCESITSGSFLKDTKASELPSHDTLKKECCDTEKDCTFCKMIRGEDRNIHIVAETHNIIVIKDKRPLRPIHYLIIPKKHIRSIDQLKACDRELAGDLLMMAQQLSERLDTPPDFKLLSNNGVNAEQTIFHIHIHFFAGYQKK